MAGGQMQNASLCALSASRSCVILPSTTETFMQTRRLGRTDLSVAPLSLAETIFG